MAVYKIKLTPIDSFFFGGVRTFNNDKREHLYREDKQNYFIRSEKFPQQSAILGMLRYQLLAQKGLLDYNQHTQGEEVASLIGTKGFSPAIENNGYEKIKDISPVFLSNDTEYLIPHSLDFNYATDEQIAIRQIIPDFNNARQQVFTTSSEGWKTAADSSGTYVYKYRNPELLINYDGTKAYKYDFEEGYKRNIIFQKNFILENGIFYPFTKIGIDKEKPDEAFYKQERYQLGKGWAFSFYVDCEEELINGHTFMGAERSCFEFSVEKTATQNIKANDMFKSKFENAFNHLTGLDAVVLTSDAFMEYGFLTRNSLHHISEFRDYKAMPGNFRSLKRSEQYVLIKRGSVIYKPTEDFFIKINDKHFQTIGYNHFIVKT